jgi:hypothetical protein
MANQLLQTILKKFRAGYFFFEDRYYDLLDKINGHVPIYKIVDPIDRVIPSFVLFLAIVFLLAATFVFFSLSSVAFSATFRAVDEDNSPIENLNISVSFPEETISLETDEWGEASLSFIGEEREATVTLSKEGFEQLTETVTLQANKLFEFVLTKIKPTFAPPKFTIYVVDSETSRLIKGEVHLSFSCSTGIPGPPPISKVGVEFKDIVPTEGCGILIAKASSANFQTKEGVSILRNPTYIKLDPVKTTTSINVLVKDHTGKSAENVEVKLFDSDNAIVDSLTTNASGTVSFAEVQPGTYTITALHSDGRYTEKTGIVAVIDSPQTVTLYLPELLVGKKIFLNLIDSETTKDVGDATVLIYANDRLLDSKKSDNSGLVEKMVGDDANSFLAVVWHQDYVTKIVSNVLVLDAASSKPQTVELTPDSEQNSGKISVRVTDYDKGEAVERAYVYLYNSDFPEVILNYPYSLSNADGNALFERLPAGNYFAKAKQGETYGKSEAKDLVLGSKISLQIVLVLTEGDIKVTVLNKLTKEPLSGAEVTFVDAFTDSVLQSGPTDEEGQFKSGLFKSDRTVYIRASKENYLEAISLPIPIIGETTQKTTIELVSKGDIDLSKNISIEFAGLYDNQAATKRATKLESGQRYYVKLNLSLPKAANYSNLTHHLRVGPESVAIKPDSMPFQDYIARLVGEVVSSPQSATIFSSCYDKDNVFSNPCVASIAAKQANTVWQTASGESVHSVVLRIETEPNLVDGTEIELRYRAKAVVNGAEFETEEFFKSFKIGQTICTPKVDCPPVVWRLWLQNPDGETSLLNNFTEEEKQTLSINMDYALLYELHNTSGYDLEANLELLADIPPAVLSIAGLGDSYTAFSALSFESDSVTSAGSPVGFQTLKEATFSQLTLSFTSERGLNDEKTLFFSVEANADLGLRVNPGSLVPNDGTQVISGFVTDQEENAIEGASVKVYLPPPEPGQPRQLFETLLTDVNGEFQTTENFSLPAGEIVLVVASSPGFRNATVEVPVKWGDFFDPRYNCVEVPSDGDETLTFSNVMPGSSRSFTVENNCVSRVEIRFNSKLDVSPKTLQIPAGGSATATLVADNPEGGEEVYLGQYPIYVKAKFEGDVRFVNAVKVLVIIADPTGSCFRIDKTSFDLVTEAEDTGTIFNDCALQFNDAWAPELALDSFKAIINREDISIPSLIQFEWGAKAKMLLSKPFSVAVEETTEGWEEFPIPTGLDMNVTFDQQVTVNIGPEFMKNVDELKFDTVVHITDEEDFRESYDDIAYIKGNQITVRVGGTDYVIDVPQCDQTGCDWDYTDDWSNDSVKCHQLEPCWYGTLSVPFGQTFEVVDSITMPIYNGRNKAFLFFNLHGDLIDATYSFEMDTNEAELELGPPLFTSAIVPIRNLGFVLGEVNTNFFSQFEEEAFFIEDANLVAYSEDPEVEVWLVDNIVYGKYVGVDTDNEPERTPFKITNLMLNTTQYNLIYVDDYVGELR